MIDLQLQDEKGTAREQFADSEALAFLMGAAPTDGTVCLRFVDPYGRTVFNQLQIPVLLAELRSRLLRLRGDQHSRAGALVAFVEQAREKPHWYVGCIGD